MSAEQDEAAVRAELARLAEKATPGPWVTEVYCSGTAVEPDNGVDRHSVTSIIADQNAAYIAAANPDTIRRLLADLDAAEERAFNAENIARLAEESEAGWRREADELAERLAAVRALADEWDASTATGHPQCQHDEDCVGCAAEDLRAALTTTPTPAAEVGRREESGR